MFERLVGLQVSNDKVYQKYRKEMMPILKQHGGGFSYDFNVSSVLISSSDSPINRVFIIYFPDQASSDAFFSHPEYTKIKEKYFNQSVQHTTLIADYVK